MCLVGAVGRGQIFQLIHDAPGLGFNPAVIQSRNVGFEVAGDGLPPRKMMGIDSEGMLISAVHEENGHEGLNLLMVDSRIPAGAKLY